MKKAISLILALMMCLSLITISAYAAPGDERASAIELKAGQSDTFKRYDDRGGVFYKFELKEASKVVISISMQNTKLNEFANLAVYHGIDGGTQQFCYVSVPGATLPEYDLHLDVGSPQNGAIPSKTGVFYLAEGWHYIQVGYMLDMDAPADITVSISSIEPIANTGGLTRQTARTVDPTKEVVKQFSYDRQDSLHDFYYKFTLTEDAAVSITKSVKPVPSNGKDDWYNSLYGGSNLRLFIDRSGQAGYPDDYEDTIWGDIDGENDVLLIISETDANLTRTINYELSAGTYYVKLHLYYACRGAEYTLSFSMPGTSVGNPLDSASEWAKVDITRAIGLGLVPGNIQDSYRQATTRAEFCALAVALYETSTGRVITERKMFNDTNDINIQKMGGLGVVDGVGEGNFAPDRSLTRQQAARVLAELAAAIGKPLAQHTGTFTDMGAVAGWATGYVGQMQGSGIMGGFTDGTFRPSGNYTREQSIATMLRMYDEMSK
jgi:hypothetical protein